MRKLSALLLGTILMFTLVACGGNETPPLSGNEQPNNEGANTLVVYFSMPETTDPNNMTKEEDNSVVVIDGKVLGNTQYVAQLIHENTGADIFRIEPKTP